MNTTNWLWLKKCFKLSWERIKDQTVECANPFGTTEKQSRKVMETLRDVESSGCHYEVKK